MAETQSGSQKGAEMKKLFRALSEAHSAINNVTAQLNALLREIERLHGRIDVLEQNSVQLQSQLAPLLQPLQKFQPLS